MPGSFRAVSRIRSCSGSSMLRITLRPYSGGELAGVEIGVAGHSDGQRSVAPSQTFALLLFVKAAEDGHFFRRGGASVRECVVDAHFGTTRPRSAALGQESGGLDELRSFRSARA